MATEEQFKKLVEKIEGLKKDNKLDLSREEDLSIAIMNLVSLEEHFFFTASKTGKNEYLDLIKEIREMRKDLLGKMIIEKEGETWCIAKHLLAASMRLMEVATKLLGDGKNSEAEDMFKKAYRLYSLFWAVRLKAIDASGVQKIRDDQVNKDDPGTKKPWTMEDIVNKLVDCCHE
ncbi:MAG: hypothetical protein Q7R98_00755 [Candidatus Jorgensenbacteria bacterium]|nr:hypothetical protein [Candidatus Jorgensenbacteria bacterium]